MTNIDELEHVKCLIIGSGPAGYTAAIYAARADLKPVVYTGIVPGGQLTQTTEVDNFPGYPQGVTGPVLMEDLKAQAERFGTEVRFGYATKVAFSQDKGTHKVQIDGSKWILAETVIIATGATAKWLGLPSEEKYNGFGVSACAVCDGFFFKGQDVAIVGAGDTAAEEATYLAKLCRKVYMLVRRDEFRASKAMVHRVMNTANIEVLYNTETQEIVGNEQGVNGVRVINNRTKEEKVLDVTGFFVAIGHKPNTELFQGILEMDETGYLITKADSTATNIPGIFACGDVQDHVYRQAITAAGTGCMAALEAERYLAAKESGE
ncbi:thioredoxin reductase (NADPH) [Sphingobacterium allocomposti]|jgi:thioredoxin reductase (NADPH)|uniref:Thioredoxin reductase n=1 Tax=Sphingobacterium allocomposti TaxID=415956 RepID=A0A5S5DCR7_9SPHI|nr:thioredoxin-disulfide reductase [Sphingobacterium composti Yoo et al. 2007 non Ten et al. 2007]TYP93158.1 thioredoxin reductase (NADPH) [Sphingobacterium composti Yoo et al. 2007 non Ten et al. 2007]HLS94462.1 thioredoxin-disulfide reductase [Sphingobacterium sp.]